MAPPGTPPLQPTEHPWTHWRTHRRIGRLATRPEALRPSLRVPANTRRRGLTLTELLVGLAIVAVLAGVTAPRAAVLLGSFRLTLGAHQLAADLNRARANALFRNTRARVRFATTRYTARYDDGEPAEVEGTLPHGVRIERVPESGVVRFFPTGHADNGSIVLTTSVGSRRSVVVNQRGRIVVR